MENSGRGELYKDKNCCVLLSFSFSLRCGRVIRAYRERDREAESLRESLREPDRLLSRPSRCSRATGLLK